MHAKKNRDGLDVPLGQDDVPIGPGNCRVETGRSLAWNQRKCLRY